MPTSRNLFDALTADFNKFLAHQRADAGGGLLVFPAATFVDVGQSLFSNLRTGGFCTLLVSGRSEWNPKSHYYEATRVAARRGCKITRAFLLPIRAATFDPALHEHWKLDAEAGIEVYAYLIGDLLSKNTVPSTQSLEFGIWDNELACASVRQEIGSTGSHTIEWRVTKRPEDMELLAGIRSTIEQKAEKITLECSQMGHSLEEPMLVSAPLAYQLAPILCRGSQIATDDCSWYHSIWQYLRLFNMVSTPTWHSDFYFKEIQRLLPKPSPSVLVSGTADYSMLAHVLWALGARVDEANVVVVDLCETPILLCKWYARFVGASVKTINGNVLDINPVQKFDLIVTDAFLTRFTPEERSRIVRKWHSILAPGGVAVTTVRVEPRANPDAVASTTAEVSRFASRARSEAQKWRDFLSISPDKIEDCARLYAEQMISHSCNSVGELSDLFADCGFEPEIKIAPVPGEMHSTNYARIVAHKKG